MALTLALAPDLVVTLGPDGGYGHRDHLATTALVSAALTAAGATPRLLHAVFPRGLFDAVRARLRRSPRGIDLLAPHLDELLGTDAAAVHLSVDARPYAALKLAALGAHQSQLPGGDPHQFLSPGLIAPLLEREWYTVASGPALPVGATDPFAGLAPHAP